MNIGIDLGGTKIQVGIEKDGRIIHKTKALLQEKDDLRSTLDQVIQFIKPLTAHKVEGIGIGVPSVVDVEKGIVYNVTNIPSWKKVALKDILEEEFNLPVFVNNDVNCFTIGEHKFGLGKDYSCMVGMSIGTGLGSGIIIGDKLYAGINCGAGEIGSASLSGPKYRILCQWKFFSVPSIKPQPRCLFRLQKRKPNRFETVEGFLVIISESCTGGDVYLRPPGHSYWRFGSQCLSVFRSQYAGKLQGFHFPESIKN